MSISGKLIRSISLIVVIVFGAAFCLILWIGFAQASYMLIPAICFTGIYVWVLVMEIVGALVGYKKTVSTRFSHWAKEHPVLAWVSLICFAIAMLALVPHLGVY